MSKARHIFRWDLDQTYLRTDFESVRGLVRTARATAQERENIPGSAALLRGLMRDGRGAPPRIYFLSGSPEQLRKVIEEKLALDGVSPDGVVLKPTLSEVFRGRFRSVTSQVAYKLAALLSGRGAAPIGSRETLFGDDAESDVFIYSLYADLVAGRVAREHLQKVLRRAGAYANQIEAIEAELEAIVHEAAVERIVVHLDPRTPPAAFSEYLPTAIPIYDHLQTALVLRLDERASPETLAGVAEELLAGYGFEATRLLNSAEDLLRRRRPHTPAEPFDRLPDELSAAAKREVAEETSEFLTQLAARAEAIKGRAPPRTAPDPGHGVRDYLELYERDERRRDDAKKAKKKGSG